MLAQLGGLRVGKNQALLGTDSSFSLGLEVHIILAARMLCTSAL